MPILTRNVGFNEQLEGQPCYIQGLRSCYQALATGTGMETIGCAACPSSPVTYILGSWVANNRYSISTKEQLPMIIILVAGLVGLDQQQ